MRNCEAIENCIREAKIQRSAYLAEILKGAFVSMRDGIKHASGVLLTVARARTRNNVFTFDA